MNTEQERNSMVEIISVTILGCSSVDETFSHAFMVGAESSCCQLKFAPRAQAAVAGVPSDRGGGETSMRVALLRCTCADERDASGVRAAAAKSAASATSKAVSNDALKATLSALDGEELLRCACADERDASGAQAVAAKSAAHATSKAASNDALKATLSALGGEETSMRAALSRCACANERDASGVRAAAKLAASATSKAASSDVLEAALSARDDEKKPMHVAL